MRYFSSLFFCFFSFSVFAQNASNVKMSTTDDQIIVTYDLEGKQNIVYDVLLKFKRENGTFIKPKTVRGDIGKVSSGEGKAIIWEVYKDMDGLSGSIEPVIEIEAPKKPITAPSQTNPTPTPPKPPVVDVDKDKAKQRRQKDIRKGFKVGFGNTGVHANRTGYKKHSSFEVGTYLRWQIRNRLYIQPEVLYHAQAYERIIDNTTSTETRHHQVRAQAIGGIAPLGFGLYFNAGLYYGYLVGGKEEINSGNTSEILNLQDIEPMNGVASPFLRHDLGYIIGGSFSLFKGSFAIGALWSNSFNNVLDTAYYVGDVANENLNLQNQSYHFFIQKRF